MAYPARRTYDIFDEMFRSAMRGVPQAAEPTTRLMKTDILENKDTFSILMELPGYEKEDLKIELKEGYLTVCAEKTAAKKAEQTETSNEAQAEPAKYLCRERFQGSCKRSFYVGDHLAEEDITASYRNGILELVFPKEKEQAPKEPKYIAIN